MYPPLNLPNRNSREQIAKRWSLFTATVTATSFFVFGATLEALAAKANTQDLILIGGGKRPVSALQAWVSAAAENRSVGHEGTEILNLGAIAWASESPDEALTGIREELAQLTTARLQPAPVALAAGKNRLSAAEKLELLRWLRTLHGLYFTGGDQNRLIDLFEKNTEIPELIASRFRSGELSLAGTSAGTAIHGSRVFTGEEDLTVIQPQNLTLRPGLQTLDGFLVDQHFLKRQRHNRLISGLIAHPDLIGLAIDEDTALVIRSTPQGWSGVTRGRGQVLILRPQTGTSAGSSTFQMQLQEPGSCFEYHSSNRQTRPCLAGRALEERP